MRNAIDLTGKRFGCLTAGHGTQWVCECDCGRRLFVRFDNLRDGRSTRCSMCRNKSGRQSVFLFEGSEDDENKIQLGQRLDGSGSGLCD